LLWIIGATLAGGVLSVAAAAVFAFAAFSAWVPRMVSFAAGALLAAAFLHLLPEAFMQAGSIEGLFGVTLAGVLAFFLLEKTALWRHRHEEEVDPARGHPHAGRRNHGRHAGMLIVVGDGFHNFVDGILIAAAFLTDVTVGLATTAAIIAHEIPQEVGDFLILLRSGYDKAKALLLNVASSLTAVAGGLIGYFALEGAREVTPYMLALAAASFIYIAVADLMPDMQRSNDTRSTLWQIALIAAGVAAIALPFSLLH
jgi:zinc and cadmium transporter